MADPSLAPYSSAAHELRQRRSSSGSRSTLPSLLPVPFPSACRHGLQPQPADFTPRLTDPVPAPATGAKPSSRTFLRLAPPRPAPRMTSSRASTPCSAASAHHQSRFTPRRCGHRTSAVIGSSPWLPLRLRKRRDESSHRENRPPSTTAPPQHPRHSAQASAAGAQRPLRTAQRRSSKPSLLHPRKPTAVSGSHSRSSSCPLPPAA